MNKISIVALIVAVIALGLNFVSFGDKEAVLGGTTNFDSLELSENLTVDGDVAFDKSAFCIDGFATSSATRVKITASTTATIEGTDGVVVYTYGACP
jgi:hypothetical protein